MLTITTVSHYPKIGDSPEEQLLRRTIAQLDRKEVDEAQLERVKDEVTRQVIEEQIDAGVEVITDGQIRWNDAITYITEKIKGFNITGMLRYFDTNTFYRQPVCTAELESPQGLVTKDFQFANTISSVPVKALLTGPYTLAKLSQDEHYRDLEKFATKLAIILGEETKRLADTGATIIQFDEPAILKFKTDLPIFKKVWAKLASYFSENIETILFLNFGNVGDILPQLLGLPVTTIGLDLATEEQNWRALAKSSFNKKLLAGIIDARNTKMETEEEIQERLQKLLGFVSAEDLAVSPNYGLEFLPRESARKKLSNLSKVVREYREAKVKA